MKTRFSRAVTAIGLGVSLWVTSIAVLAAPQQSPSKDQPQGPSQPAATQPGQNSGTTSAPEQPASNHKPLSTNEDPTMIGKRNINKDIWGRMAAGTEKEVRE